MARPLSLSRIASRAHGRLSPPGLPNRPRMSAVSNFLDEVVLTASSADGPVQAWDVRTGMQLKAYKCVPTSRRRPTVPTRVVRSL